MVSTKISAFLLISMLLISSATTILGCGSCGKPPGRKHPKGKSPKGIAPIITLPPIVKPPITLPPVTVPPITKPPSTIPLPPAPTAPATCPISTLKLGACVDLLGGLVHVGLGDPVVNECCPVLSGLVELEAAVCLCTALKIKLLNLNIFVLLLFNFLSPVARQLPLASPAPFRLSLLD